MLNAKSSIVKKTLFLIGITLASTGITNEDNAINNFITKQYQVNIEQIKEIESLKESITQLTYQLQQIKANYKSLSDGIAFNLKNNQAIVQKKLKSSQSVIISNKAYRQARNLMRSEQYDRAIKALSQYLKDYPKSENYAEAKFWLANSYAANGQFGHAARKYLLFSIQHKNHSKIPDALYRLAIAQNELGQADKAKLILDSVARRFPQHKIIELVNKSLAVLKRSQAITAKTAVASPSI